MKCGACGYEKRSKFVNTATVKRFKSGKHKGEIKEVEEKQIDVFEKDPQFIKVMVAKGEVETNIKVAPSFYNDDGYREVEVFACPKCGTLKIDEDRINYLY